jgi:hypothetical protein
LTPASSSIQPDYNNVQHLSQEDSHNVDTNTSENITNLLESGFDVRTHEQSTSLQNVPFKREREKKQS